jgi:tetratricopeptide (TPR) repeat protein
MDVVEIEPAVVEASPFFRRLHGGVLEDSRVRTVIADSRRNFLLTTRERYDVIISKPSNPWMSGQFQRALELDPQSLPAQVGMSIVLLQGDRIEEAFRLARQVAAREHKNAPALFVAGIAAGRLRRPDEVLTLIRQAVAIEPGYAKFQVALRHLERTVVKP